MKQPIKRPPNCPPDATHGYVLKNNNEVCELYQSQRGGGYYYSNKLDVYPYWTNWRETASSWIDILKNESIFPLEPEKTTMKSEVTINKIENKKTNRIKVFDIPQGTFFYGKFERDQSTSELFIKGYDQITRLKDGEQWDCHLYMEDFVVVDVEIKTNNHREGV